MDKQVLIFARNEKTAAAAIEGAGGRLLHVFTPRVFVAQLPSDVDPREIKKVSTVAPLKLKEEDRLFADAWEGLQQQQAAARFESVAEPPLKWDTPGYLPPDIHDTTEALPNLALESPDVAESTNTPTSLYLTGKVAVGIVNVSGSSWTQIAGALKWVSVGTDGTVWGVNSSDQIFKRSGNSWTQIAGALKQISVGSASQVWGVNASDQIFKRSGNSWTQIAGALKNVSVAADGTVWGVNSANNIFQRTGNSWTQIAGALKQISVGSASQIWGVNASDQIFKRTGNSWTQIPGALSNVSVAADGSVFGVNSAGNIFRYISSNNTWQRIPGALVQISAGSESKVWGVNSAGNIFSGNASSGLNFSTSEIQTIISEVQEGLNFLASAEPAARVTFYYDWRTVNVWVTPGPVPSSSPYESMEAPWRNAALIAMGFPGSTAGSVQYVNHIKQQFNTDWAYVAYFTKYPLNHFAYQISERLVMHYDNDGWGPARINQVFAHESCHVFGAADEYGSCGCGNSGHFSIPNSNCVNCTSSQTPCLMNANTLSLCEFSRGQIGWSTWTRIAGALKWVSVGTDGTVWGVNSSDQIFKRSGNSWTQIAGALKQISVGSASQVWGVNASDQIFKRSGNSWTQIAGALKNVSVAADGTVWGVNSANNIFQRTGNSWTQIAGALKQISVGSASQIWGVNASDQIFKRTGNSWTQIPGALSNVSVAADGTVWGVNSAGNIFRWTGTNWQQILGGLMQISVGSVSQVWGVNSASNIFQRRILATP